MKIPYEVTAISEPPDKESFLVDYTIDLSEVKAYGSMEDDTYGMCTEIVFNANVLVINMPYKEFRKVMRHHFRPHQFINLN